MFHSNSDLWKNFSLGVARGAILFPVEHPLELLKVMAQATPEQMTWKIASKVFAEKGVMGFTDTALTNFPRRLLRESVRWPVIGMTHNILINNFPGYFKKEGVQAEIVTSISIALFESLFVLPLEQLIAYRVKEKERYVIFFQNRFCKKGISSLYNGASVNFIRQGVMWTTILTLNNLCKNKFDKIDKEKKHPYLKQGITSICTAFGLVTWVLPIDFVKTRIQMDANLQNKSLLKVVHILARQHAPSHFYAGALPIFIHTLFHATFSGYLMDKIFSKTT